MAQMNVPDDSPTTRQGVLVWVGRLTGIVGCGVPFVLGLGVGWPVERVLGYGVLAAVRQRVRKRDVSFGPGSNEGVVAWDAFQTIVATACKLNVNVYDYLHTLVCGSQGSPRLAHLIVEQAHALQLSASWVPAKPQPAWHRILVQP
jgi:hypothetical protein